MRDLVGQRLGHYELREVIGRGSLSTVYEAYQPSRNRVVAVKVLADPGDPQFVIRFRRKARLIAQLRHRNIVPVYDHGDEDGLVYLVLQYVEGRRTLADLAGWPLRPADAVELLMQLLAGLGYGHARGFVHLDIKPNNVLLPAPGRPLLADFGIAELLLESSTKSTGTGQFVGTAAYMAPEQALGLAGDARTDLYAAGVVLNELLTGRVPFEADTYSAVLLHHAFKAPPPPSELAAELPAELEAVVLRALAKEPADRYQTADDMARALQALQADLEPPSMSPFALTTQNQSVDEAPEVTLADPETLTAAVGPVVRLAPESGSPPGPRPPRTRRSHRRQKSSGIGMSVGAKALLAFLPIVALLGFLAWITQQAAPVVAESEVVLESAPTLGSDPFTPNLAAPPVPITPTIPPAPSGPARVLRGQRGSTPGLYGGARSNPSCDREQMSAFFQAHPDQAAAWVEALNSDLTLRWSGGTKVKVEQIPAYLQTLTPVVLRVDTRVTNNGFLNGQPAPRQSVLQAGTAVLVDGYGVPRARCAGGNPLLMLHPIATAPRYRGQPWSSFDPAKLVVIRPSPTLVDTFTLIDIHSGQPFQRPTGTIGPNDLPIQTMRLAICC